MDFFYPTKTIPVSVTNKQCSLGCSHCGGHYLSHMVGIVDICKKQSKVFNSILISGGCNRQGEVPILRHTKEILRLKSRYRIIAHTGLLPPHKAIHLKGLVDVISFDFPPSNSVVRDVFGLDKTLDDYIESLDAIRKVAPTVPHITVGIKGGIINGEKESLEKLSDMGFHKIIFNVFIPTAGTDYSNRQPPQIQKVISLLKMAKRNFDTVYLGCMRPCGEYRHELDKVSLGIVDGIVMPSPCAVHSFSNARKNYECCAL